MKRKLYIILTMFTVLSWGGLNYVNYHLNNVTTSQIIQENTTFIDDVVDDITIQQHNLKETQFAIEGLPEGVTPFLGDKSLISKDVDLNDLSKSDNTLVTELQHRINELETEKRGYVTEKMSLTKTIAEKMNIFKWDVGNPMLNIVILPLVLYIGKKILDILFRLLSNEIFEEDEA